MKKSKHPLFVLLELATRDDNALPNVKMFSCIEQMYTTNFNPHPILNFVTLSLKAYAKRFVSTLTAFYNLCLVEYLATQTDFKLHLDNKPFFEAFESTAKLDELVGHFRSKPSFLQKKCLALVQLFKETSTFFEGLYLRYCEKGVVFTPTTTPFWNLKWCDICCSKSTNIDQNYSTIPTNIKEMIITMSYFRGLAIESLKRSNLIRNGKLQTKHLGQINIAFLSEANRLLSKYHSMLANETFSEEDEAFIWEESRKTSHIMHIFQHETKRIKKLEKRLMKELRVSNTNSFSSTLIEQQSPTIRALLSSQTIFPKTRSSVTRITEIISKSHARSINSEEESRTSTDSPTPLNTQIPVISSFKPDSAKKDKAQHDSHLHSSYLI